MTNRREFLAGVGGLVGLASAGQTLSQEVKTCPPKAAMEIGLDRQGENWSNDPLDRFTLVTRERITQEFANDESAVPVHEIIGQGKTFGMAQADAWKQIRMLLMGFLLQNTIDFSDKEKSLLYLDEFPVCFGFAMDSKTHYVEIGYFVAVKLLS